MRSMMRSLMVVAAFFAIASAPALAQDRLTSQPGAPAAKAVQMTDEQLDQITAGSAFVVIAISNPGNVMRPLEPNGHGNQVMCINCGVLPERQGGSVLLGVINKGHPVTDPIFKCLGRCTLF